MSLDLVPFFAEALAHADNIRRSMDEIYSKHKEAYFMAAKESPFYSSPICTENSLLTEEYFKKALGLLEYFRKTKEESTEECLWNLFKKGYKKTYQYFKDTDEEMYDMEKYVFNSHSFLKKLDDDAYNGNLMAAIFFTKGRCTNLDIILKYFSERWEHYNGHHRISLAKLSNSDYSKLDELYKKIPKDIINEILRSKHDKKIQAFEFLYDMEGLSSLSLFREISFNQNDIKELLLAYIKGNELNEVPENKMDVDVEYYLIAGLHLKAMLKAYKKVKEMYFDNNKETMYVEMGALKKELMKTRSDLKLQEQNYDQLKQESAKRNKELFSENVQLKKKIKELENQVNQTPPESNQ